MKKTVNILALLICLVLLASCGTGKPIKIGYMGTVSGSSNDLALSGLHGLGIAVQEINEAGGINGRQIELVVKDTINDKTITKRAVDEFIREGVEIVIGEFTSSLMETALDQDINQKILFLSPTASSGVFSGRDDNMIRFIGETEKQGVLIYGQAARNKDKKFIIIKDAVNRTFVDATSNEFIQVMESEGGTVLHEEIADYASIIRSKEVLENLREKYPQADAILYLLDPTNTTLFLQSMDEIGWNLGIYTSFWVNTGDFIKLGSQYIEGVHTIGFVEDGELSVLTREFEQSYYRHFGTRPSFSAYFAYDAMNVLREALENKNRINVKEIKEYITKHGMFHGTAGSFSIDEFGDCSREYKSQVIKDGKVIAFKLD